MKGRMNKWRNRWIEGWINEWMIYLVTINRASTRSIILYTTRLNTKSIPFIPRLRRTSRRGRTQTEKNKHGNCQHFFEWFWTINKLLIAFYICNVYRVTHREWDLYPTKQNWIEQLVVSVELTTSCFWVFETIIALRVGGLKKGFKYRC